MGERGGGENENLFSVLFLFIKKNDYNKTISQDYIYDCVHRSPGNAHLSRDFSLEKEAEINNYLISIKSESFIHYFNDSKEIS
jgi:hypothetical protein